MIHLTQRFHGSTLLNTNLPPNSPITQASRSLETFHPRLSLPHCPESCPKNCDIIKTLPGEPGIPSNPLLNLLTYDSFAVPGNRGTLGGEGSGKQGHVCPINKIPSWKQRDGRKHSSVLWPHLGRVHRDDGLQRRKSHRRLKRGLTESRG